VPRNLPPPPDRRPAPDRPPGGRGADRARRLHYQPLAPEPQPAASASFGARIDGAAAAAPEASGASTGAVGFALALILMAAATASVLTGGWPSAAAPTLLVALLAVTEATLLARSGLSRLGAILFAVPLCAAVVVPVTIGSLPAVSPGGGVLPIIGQYVGAAFTGLFASDDWSFTVGLCSALWLCGYWVGWVAFRERRGVLAVLPILVVLACNALNAPSVRRSTGAVSGVGAAEAVALLAAVVLVGLAQLGDLDFGWNWRRVPTLPGLGTRFRTSALLAAVGVVLASLLIPPASTTAVSGSFLFGPRLGGGPGGGGGVYVGFSPTVVPGGALKGDDATVFTYYTDQGVSAYLGAVNDIVFTNGDWGVNEDPASTSARPVTGTISRDPQGLGPSESGVTLHIAYTASATPQAGTNLALFAGEPTSVDHDGTAVGEASAQGFLTVDQVDLGTGALTNLVTSGMVNTATQSELEAAGTDYPSWVGPGTEFTSFPSTATNAEAAVIHNLALAWTAGAANPYDAATDIEAHLRQTGAFFYTLSPPAAPSGTWPIVYFLTNSHQGYCQYFASSMGAMLRSLGIPSRLVTGYGPGLPTGKFTLGGQPYFRVTSDNAHAWVEAYFPTYGWIPFEPTPPSAEGNYATFQRGAVATPLPTSAATATAAPPRAHPTPIAATHGAPRSPGGSRFSPVLVIAPAAVLVVALLLFLSLLWWRRPRTLNGAWRRLGLAARLAGLEREPCETRAAFARRLADALEGTGPPLLGRELATVAQVSGKAEFSRSGLDGTDRDRWLGAWAVIARRAPRLLRRRAGRSHLV
jgi:hypothetical protein